MMEPITAALITYSIVKEIQNRREKRLASTMIYAMTSIVMFIDVMIAVCTGRIAWSYALLFIQIANLAKKEILIRRGWNYEDSTDSEKDE